MALFNNLPIFRVNVDNDNCTITTISLVDSPAMEVDMILFKNDRFHFSTDNLHHNIMCCIVRTDYPILREQDGNPFYIVFDKQTTEKLAKKLMRDGYQQNVSLDHSGNLISGITLQEVFLKDSEKGISPVGFENCGEGSLFGIYHIEDNELWGKCVAGEFHGVSLESYLSLEKFEKLDKTNINKKTTMSKIKEKLKALLLEFNSLSTDRADLFWEEDTELNVGYKVFVENDNQKVPAPDGEYLSDNKIKVENGIVTEIEKIEEIGKIENEEVEVDLGCQKDKKDKLEEVNEEVKEEVNVNDTKILEDRISALENKIEEIIRRLSDIEMTPAAPPVVEEFEKVTLTEKSRKTGIREIDRQLSFADRLKSYR